jgi:branched-chain amino acid transport system ATP-binding protein
VLAAEAPEVDGDAGLPDPSGGADGLRVEGITVTFGGLTALDDVCLSVAAGEVVGVIGPNGAGKTTLFNVICGFVRPSAGRIVLFGRPLRRHRPQHLADLGVARTLQATGLLAGLSAVENVMAGATARSRAGVASALAGLPRSSRDERRLRERAMTALERVGVAEYAEREPRSLSHAVAKRVALARALAGAPSLLLLDEPASGLSESEGDSLRALVRELGTEMAVLLVEHDMDLVMATCDRIVVLDFGRVIACGTPGEIRDDPAVAEAYLGREPPPAGGHDARG